MSFPFGADDGTRKWGAAVLFGARSGHRWHGLDLLHRANCLGAGCDRVESLELGDLGCRYRIIDRRYGIGFQVARVIIGVPGLELAFGFNRLAANLL